MSNYTTFARDLRSRGCRTDFLRGYDIILQSEFPIFERLKVIEGNMLAFFNRAKVVPPYEVVYEWCGVKVFMSLEYRRRKSGKLLPVCYLNYYVYGKNGRGAKDRVRFSEAGYERILGEVQNRGMPFNQKKKKEGKKMSENKNEFARVMTMMKMQDEYIIRKGFEMEIPDDYPYKALVQDILRKVQVAGDISERQKKSLCIALAKFGKNI